MTEFGSTRVSRTLNANRESTTRRVATAVLALSLLTAQTADAHAENLSDEHRHFFEQHVRPLLADRCLECHSMDSEEAGGNLRLDSRAGWSRGGDSGPAVVPGKPEQSLLIQAVRYTHDELQMPPDERLAPREIRILEEWVSFGAPDPRDATLPIRESEFDLEAGRSHWSFQTPHGREHPPPQVGGSDWPTNEIDRFVLAELQRRGLTPAPPADRRTLIRRATWDLTGLPPTPAETRAFLNDDSPAAYADLIDRLLASPRYGQRWGRYWLDVARYADSNGLDENIAHGNAWRYRDYVIAAFNDDKPFDQFVREQLAGDLLTPATDEALRRERLIATGFLSLGPKVLAEVDEAKMEMDIIDEQVDTVGRAFMGLTLGCARCHDHKFDPIRIEDYYALAGIFKSTRTMEHFTKIARWREVTIASEGESKRYASRQHSIDEAQARIDELTDASANKSGGNRELDDAAEEERNRLQQELARLKAGHRPLPSAMAVGEYDQPTDLRVHIRGSVLNQGEVVPRGFPAVLVSTDADSATIDASASGRLELARWLTDARHPLVARVMVNRIWRWHFGKGLVETTDNVGHLGGLPVNQPLLDWLANRFVADGWFIKRMHRLMMLSSTYRMGSTDNAANAAIDAGNRYHWRFRVRRLDAEALRDGILAVSGRLDTSMGGSLLHVGNREFLFDHTSKDQTTYVSTRRSVYLPVIRNHLFDGFQLFDYNNASVVNSNRATTTVAPQALYLMNSELLRDSAVAFAARVCGHSDSADRRIDLVYRLAFARSPRPEEALRAKRYLSTFAQQLERNGGDSRAVARTAESGGSAAQAQPVMTEQAPVEPAPRSAPTSDAPPPPWVLLCQAILMSNEFIIVR